MATKRTPGVRPVRRGERGSALVLAIMILLAMLGLGMMAMRTTTQNLSGSGNLRTTKQARYVAEAGLYHAIAMMKPVASGGWGEEILRMRAPDATLEIDSEGNIRVLGPDLAVQSETTRPAPPYFRPGADVTPPPALGQYGTGAGLVPSYRVTIDGFTPAPPRVGTGLETYAGEGGDKMTECRMHFTARGYIADVVLPTAAALQVANRERVFSEHALSAAIDLGPFESGLCRRL